jgi:two-component system chemotaxis response regulator CheY
MKKRVLLADDTQLMRELLRDALDRDKFEIVGEALTGEEAVIKYGELKPDLVIMDINMPKMNGIEALTVIMKKHPDARIIMCSDQKYQGMILRAIKNGAKDFIVKPFKKEDVLEAVNKAFEEDEEA